MNATEARQSFESFCVAKFAAIPGECFLKYDETNQRYVRNHVEDMYQCWVDGQGTGHLLGDCDGYKEGYKAGYWDGEGDYKNHLTRRGYQYLVMESKVDASVAPPTAQDLNGSWYDFSHKGEAWTVDGIDTQVETIPVVARDTRIGINDEIAPEYKSKRIRDWGFE